MAVLTSLQALDPTLTFYCNTVLSVACRKAQAQSAQKYDHAFRFPASRCMRFERKGRACQRKLLGSGPILSVQMSSVVIGIPWSPAHRARYYYLRADAVPPTSKKRGRRRLTALEVLQAKSAFCRSQRIFLRLACSWERFEGSAEATKGAPVPPIGGLTVLRIPSKKGKAGMLLDLGTRVGWRASRGA